MKNILLICSAGITTGTLVKKMKEEADTQKLDINITSVGVAEVSQEIGNADVVILSPQAGYLKPTLKDLINEGVQIDIMDASLYAEMNGKELLNNALKMI